MVVMAEMTDEKNIESQLRQGKPGVFSVSVLDVKSLPKMLEWEQDGCQYRAYLLAPQYRIEQLNKLK
jgi:hypothetical protein